MGGFPAVAKPGQLNLPAFNMVPSASIGWRRGLNNMLNGVRPAKILCIGDSQTRGYGQGVDSVGFPGDLASVLTGRGFSTAKGLCCPEFSRGAQTADPRITYGAGWALASALHTWWAGIGPYWTAPAAAGGVLTYSPATLCNAFDVYYWSVAGLGGMTVTPTGVAGTVVNTATTPGTGIGKVTVHTATNANNNTVTIGTITTAAVVIIGIEAYEDPAGPGTPAPQVLIANAGVNGANTFGWVDNTNPTYGPKAAITAYNPDLALIMLGPNDYNALQPINTVVNNMLQIAGFVTALGGSAWFMSSIPCSPTLAAFSQLPPHESALINQGYGNGIPVLCHNARWGGLNGFNVLNPLGWYFDTIHPDQIGYWDLATTIATALLEF